MCSNVSRGGMGGWKTIRARLVHCNDYYIGIRISITRNTLSWNVISITIH